MTTYAKDGYSYYSVETPSFFCERLLPLDPTDDTGDERRKRVELDEAAERHGTYVRSHPHRRG